MCFSSPYADGSLESRAATPVLYANTLVGAVYLMEYDTDQGRTDFCSAIQYLFGSQPGAGVCAESLSLVFSDSVFSEYAPEFSRLSGVIREGGLLP